VTIEVEWVEAPTTAVERALRERADAVSALLA
jgi:hypothetical protein